VRGLKAGCGRDDSRGNSPRAVVSAAGDGRWFGRHIDPRMATTFEERRLGVLVEIEFILRRVAESSCGGVGRIEHVYHVERVSARAGDCLVDAAATS